MFGKLFGKKVASAKVELKNDKRAVVVQKISPAFSMQRYLA